MTNTKSGRSRSGKARMARMSPEERKDMAKKGAQARWSKPRSADADFHAPDSPGKPKLGRPLKSDHRARCLVALHNASIDAHAAMEAFKDANGRISMLVTELIAIELPRAVRKAVEA